MQKAACGAACALVTACAGVVFALGAAALAAPLVPGTVTEFSTGITASALPYGIAAGPDGNLWFTEYVGNRIGRITPTGTITEYAALPTGSAFPTGIAAGADGNLWFTESAGTRIGRITPTGTVTEFSAGITAFSTPLGIAAGADGNLWFTEQDGNRLGRITSGQQMPFDRPVISGLPQVGRPLTCTAGLWPAALSAITRQWLRAGSPITGATSQTYTPVADDLGQPLTCRITASFAALLTTAGADSDPVTITTPETGPVGPLGPAGRDGRDGQLVLVAYQTSISAKKVTVRYALTGPAKITLTVTAPKSRSVKVATATGKAGLNAISWNRRLHGKPANKGIYKLKLTGTADGRTARSTINASLR